MGEKQKIGLNKLGCVPNKSLIIEFPTSNQVPDHLIHHFMRGFFDGDGWIAQNQTNKKIRSVGICAPLQFCQIYTATLSQKCFINPTKIGKHITPGFGVVSYEGNRVVEKIFQFLYKDATIYLQRKYDRFTINRDSIKRYILEDKMGNIIEVNDGFKKFCDENGYRMHSLIKNKIAGLSLQQLILKG